MFEQVAAHAAGKAHAIWSWSVRASALTVTSGVLATVSARCISCGCAWAARGAKLGPMRAIAALLILLWAQAAVGQTRCKRADAAYSSGDRELAKSLYQSVLASDPNNSRAIFQLARL